jgi:type I restriction enzyme M protein
VAIDDFVECHRPVEPLDNREESERFKAFTYDELIARDKVNLDIIWLKDPSLDDADSLLPPDVIAREIVEDLEAAFSEFAAIGGPSSRPSATPNDPRSSRNLVRLSTAVGVEPVRAPGS